MSFSGFRSRGDRGGQGNERGRGRGDRDDRGGRGDHEGQAGRGRGSTGKYRLQYWLKNITMHLKIRFHVLDVVLTWQ